MNPTFKRWLICILLLILFLGLAHVHAVDVTPVPGSSSAKVGIPTHTVSKQAESSVKRTAVQSRVKTGLKSTPVRIVRMEPVRHDVSESMRLPGAKLGNSRDKSFSKPSGKGALEPADARVWIFLWWPGACFLGE